MALPPPPTPADVQRLLLTNDWQNELTSILRFDQVNYLIGGINGGTFKGTYRNGAEGNQATQLVEGSWVLPKAGGVLLSWSVTFRILKEGNTASTGWAAVLQYGGPLPVEPYIRSSWTLSSLDKGITPEGVDTFHPVPKSGGPFAARHGGGYPSPFKAEEVHAGGPVKSSDPNVISQVLLTNNWVFVLPGAHHSLDFRQATVEPGDPSPLLHSQPGGVLTGFYRITLVTNPPVTEEFILEGTWAVDTTLGVISYSTTSTTESGAYSGILVSVPEAPPVGYRLLVKGYPKEGGNLVRLEFVGQPKAADKA